MKYSQKLEIAIDSVFTQNQIFNCLTKRMPIYNDPIKQKPAILSVSALNSRARLMLEDNFRTVWVEGELSNLVQAQSGHYYFKLKDDKASIQCAFFRGKASRLNFTLKNGQQLLAKAKVSLYEARGDYQLIIDSLEEAGLGLLQQKFNALKEKLQTQGFFDEDKKKPLPTLPKQIGVITSPKAAALHDILTTLKRRFSAIPVILYPTEVQGARAADLIAKAITKANERNECDVLILARGGGSIEDLWSFNEEVVAEAIIKSKLPIVTGVGHEIDFTIADFCADLRAPTPTAAAESVTPDMDTILESLVYTHDYLEKLIISRILTLKEKLAHLTIRLKAPSHLIYQHYQTVDKMRRELQHLILQLILRHRNTVHLLESRLNKQNLPVKLSKQKEKLNKLRLNLIDTIQQLLQTKRLQLERLCATLHATSPLATLSRGYSLTLTEEQKIVLDVKQLSIGETFWVKLKNGQLHGELKDIKQ